LILLRINFMVWCLIVVALFVLTYLFFHELIHYIHLLILKGNLEEVCFVGFMPDGNRVGWVKGDSYYYFTGDASLYEFFVEIVAFCVTSLIFFLFLRKKTEVI
jgi:hypothetical protein